MKGGFKLSHSHFKDLWISKEKVFWCWPEGRSEVIDSDIDGLKLDTPAPRYVFQGVWYPCVTRVVEIVEST